MKNEYMIVLENIPYIKYDFQIDVKKYDLSEKLEVQIMVEEKSKLILRRVKVGKRSNCNS